ncbi:TetR/AcrR family transcriptional regulator [Oxalobacteraceae bacterium]|nr:TetR/AcrR family transcriptional regulator [Oxalobacteraceae bacterium]
MQQHILTTRTGRPRNADRELRDSETVRTACALFIAHGYNGVSLKTIAAEARIAVRTIYLRFGGKLGLFQAVIAAEREQMLAGLPDFPPGARPLETVLGEICLRYLNLVNSDRALAILRMVIAEAGQSPELGQAFYDAGPGAMRAHLTAMFSHPALRSRFRPELPPALLTGLLLACLLDDPTLRLLRQLPTQAPQEQVRKALDAFFAATRHVEPPLTPIGSVDTSHACNQFYKY